MQQQKVVLFFTINLIFTTLLSLIFLIFNKNYQIIDFIFTLFALISTVSTIYLIYLILTFLFFRFSITKYFLAILFIMTNILLLSDFAIYRIWGFHINTMVLNILFSPAAYDSLYITSTSIVIIFSVITILILFEIFFLKIINKLETTKIKNYHL